MRRHTFTDTFKSILKEIDQTNMDAEPRGLKVKESLLTTLPIDPTLPFPNFRNRHEAFYFIPLIIIFVIFEWIGRREEFALSNIEKKWKKWVRHIIYYSILIAIVIYAGEEQQFIYFQF